MSNDPNMSFVAFSLGPVQTFIEAARGVRDLWTGSYLLAWLIRQAMEECVSDQSVIPHPLALEKTGNLHSPCLPNLFIAELPAEQAKDLAKRCEKKCKQKWEELCRDVYKCLQAKIEEKSLPHRECWRQEAWDAQVNSFWDMRTAVLPWAECDEETLQKLLARRAQNTDPDDRLWMDRLELLNAVQAAGKLRRHIPQYEAQADDAGRYPGKCSLLGSYEQMGPAGLQESREFWEAFAKQVDVDGTRVRQGERLCAVSLVKRFAWPVFLRRQVRENARAMRFEDTATVAAMPWLDKHSELKQYSEKHHGSQWLHWSRRDQDKEDGEREVDLSVWNELLEARHKEKPPTYYAILMLDGDKMGEKFRAAEGKKTHQDISKGLVNFATEEVPKIVEDGDGTLIYAGGDDVLVLSPTAKALAVASRLAETFQKKWKDAGLPEPDKATVSAGLAVVHYKEDLRFALGQARAAEKAAKKGGRNALQLRVCRRSGEHSAALVPWEVAGCVADLVDIFLKGVSDRWAYKLRAELPTLQGKDIPGDLVQAEVGRLLRRLEKADRDQIETPALGFLEAYRKATACRGQSEAQALEGFVILCQSASFLARGREE